MPKSQPISLQPLSFREALQVLLQVGSSGSAPKTTRWHGPPGDERTQCLGNDDEPSNASDKKTTPHRPGLSSRSPRRSRSRQVRGG